MGQTESATLAPSRSPARGGAGFGLLLAWALTTMAWFGLAFFPVRASTPVWLGRLQSVCFGSAADGLPDSFGWMLLVLGTGSLLAGILVTYADELRASWRRGLRSGPSRVLVFLVLGLFSLEAGWVVTRVVEGYRIRNVSYASPLLGSLPEGYPRRRDPAPDFALVDQSGTAVSLASLKGRTVLLTFAFAHCQTVCPTLVHSTLQAYLSLDPARTAAVFITLDPWRDTPGRLPDLAKKWNLPPGARVLSGEVPLVTAALDGFGIPWQRDARTGEVTHPALVYVLDGDGKIAYAFNNPPGRWLTDAVRRIAR